MNRIACFCLLFFSGMALTSAQGGGELVYTATEKLVRAEKFLETENFDSALYYCQRAFEKAPSFREVYITRHKVFDAMGMEPSVMIENIKAGQQVSKEDEEFAYYLGQTYHKNSQFAEAVEAYSKAIEYSQAHDGDITFRYFYYAGRGTSYLKDRKYAEAIADFTSGLEIDPESTGALINRGFCFYNTKNKKSACDDWRMASGAGSKAASQYISQYCN